MFDLFRSRRKAVRYLLGALLMLVAISMVITLVPGFGTGGSAQDQIVAEVGDETLTALEVHQTIRTQVRGQNFPAEMAAIYVPQIVNQLITESAVAYQAQRMGFKVTEEDLALTIESVFPQLFEGGRFAGTEVYQAFLAQQNLTIQQFERNLRKVLLLNKLRSLVLGGIVVSPEEMDQEFRRRNEKVTIEYVAISPDKLRPLVNVTPTEIREHFNQNRASFRVPEQRSFQMLVIDEERIAQSITVPEADLRRAYEVAKDSYRTPERVKVRHILLKTTDVADEEIPKIKVKAEDLLKQLQQGADFAELARKNSDDTVSGGRGGDLDWVARGQTVKAFEETAFSLEPKQLSNVITTQYGFHILQVLDKQEAHLRPFEEVRNELEGRSKKQLVFDRVQNLADQARAALNKDPLRAGQVANELGVPLVNVEKVAAGEPIPGLGVSRELEDAILPLRKGEVSSVVQAQPTKLVVAVVTDIIPTRPAELSEVEAEIRGSLVEAKLSQLAQQRAQEALEKARAFDGDLKRVSRSMGLDWKLTPEFGRNGAAEGLGSAESLEAAFTGNVGDVFGPVSAAGRQFVCKVVDKIPADLSQFATERDNIQQQLKSQKATERSGLFEEGLRNQLIEEGEVKIHQDVVDRLVASYTGR
jgi:peptidyl-prolyl cis-trans isomerase D